MLCADFTALLLQSCCLLLAQLATPYHLPQMVEWGDGKIDTKTRLLGWEAPSECPRGLLVTVLSPLCQP